MLDENHLPHYHYHHYDDDHNKKYGPFVSSLQYHHQPQQHHGTILRSFSPSEQSNSNIIQHKEKQYDAMIYEFWNNTNSTKDSVFWTTLPIRINTLVHRMDEIMITEVVTSTTTTTTNTMEERSFQNLSTIITASLLLVVQKPSSSSSSSAFSSLLLLPALENFLYAALVHSTVSTTMMMNHNNTNDDTDTMESLLSVYIENYDTDIPILFHIFGDMITTTTMTTTTTNNDTLTLFYQNLRRLGWIQTPSLSSVSSVSSSSHSNHTNSNNNYFVQEILFQKVIPKLITKHIRSMILGQYDDTNENNDDNNNNSTSSTFQSILDWTDQTIVPWLCHDVFGRMMMEVVDQVSDNTNNINPTQSNNNTLNNQIRNDIHSIVIQIYWSIRLHELFDMITSYPDSLPALLELKFVFHLYMNIQQQQQMNHRSISVSSCDASSSYESQLLLQELAVTLRNSCMVRLNHPGANTTQMIDIYIATIQVLRLLLLVPSNSNNPSDPNIVSSSSSSSSNFHISSKHMDTIIAYITEPIRSYLRHYRNDTVRCILTSLTSTGNSSTSTHTTTHNGGSSTSHTNAPNQSQNNIDNSSTSGTATTGSHPHVLYQELRRQDTKPLEYMTMNSDDEDDDEEECPTMDWQPRPSIYTRTGHMNQEQQQSRNHHHYHRSGTKNDSDSDILAMLVSIYGSKELFVNEYRSMLADKLLGSNYTNNDNNNNSTDQDIHTLELLKLRFGEMSLINAEVMIKDMEDSARINKNIRDAYMAKKKTTTTLGASTDSTTSTINTTTSPSSDIVVVDAAIVSHVFWPKLHTSSFKHHPRIQNVLDEYATIYAEQKNPRILHWYNHLGSIQLELDVIEEQMDVRTGTIVKTLETKEFHCSPLLATLISHFEDESTWTAEQLSDETNLPDHIIVKQMSYWVTQRVVLLCTTTTTSQQQQNSISRHSSSSTNYHHPNDTSKITYTLASKAEQNESKRTTSSV